MADRWNSSPSTSSTRMFMAPPLSQGFALCAKEEGPPSIDLRRRTPPLLEWPLC